MRQVKSHKGKCRANDFMNYKYLVGGNGLLVAKVIDFFTSKVVAPALFAKIQAFRQNTPSLQSQVPNFKACLALGHLSVWDFLLYEGEYAQKHGISVVLVEDILERMCSAQILFRQTLLENATCRVYAANEGLFRYLGENNCV